jgi:hypothetical protein
MSLSGVTGASTREERKSEPTSLTASGPTGTPVTPARSCNWCGTKNLKINRLDQVVCRNPRCGRVQP